MGAPPNHPFIDGFSVINPPFWGTTIYGTSHIYIYTYTYLPTINMRPFSTKRHVAGRAQSSIWIEPHVSEGCEKT